MRPALFSSLQYPTWTRVLMTASVTILLALLGCQQNQGQDATKCSMALATARQALSLADMTLVQRWRAYAHTKCEISSIHELDADIRAKQNQFVETQVKNHKAKEVFRLTTELAAAYRTSPTGTCHPQGHPEAGWCVANKKVQDENLTVTARYRDKEPTWAAFSTEVQGEADCASLGGSVSREWSVERRSGGTARRTHCVLGAPLAGYQALISIEPDATRLLVATDDFVRRDSTLARQLNLEGRTP